MAGINAVRMEPVLGSARMLVYKLKRGIDAIARWVQLGLLERFEHAALILQVTRCAMFAARR